MSNENKMAPAQLIKVLVGIIAFVVVVIYLLAKLATSGFDVNAEVMTKEAVAARLKPVGESVAGDPPGSRTGEGVYTALCASCHAAGLAGSPKFGDNAAWAPRIGKGEAMLFTHAISGFNAMPARGGGADLTDDEVKRAVVYMVNHSGGKFAEPAAGADASAPAGAVAGLDPAVAGKKVYDAVCVACHATGVAGAPKFGDKAAWAPRLKPGLAEVIAISTKGLNAMPPKGGFTGPDDEFKAAVEYMVNAAK
ncbi:c-type cytochrome [Craterilacuibacter sp. RT1T]|uniref:c-type cytochrome n=1 Tax=Craterilacuibacter sp. RT1T TaxID=2942211 RepID=UPI0020BF1363|nr:c-type cytochrome [Craterilacuibacter sp. RT1T]MCL6264258.1 c-type cytochrome [Craterilacuibacter sp. RT1T]